MKNIKDYLKIIGLYICKPFNRVYYITDGDFWYSEAIFIRVDNLGTITMKARKQFTERRYLREIYYKKQSFHEKKMYSIKDND